MQISIDVDRMMRDIKENQDAFKAMRNSTDQIGYGAVMTGHRRGSAAQRERRRQDIRDIRAAGVRRAAPFAFRIMTGWGIADFLRKKGTDPFEYPTDEVTFVATSMEEEIGEALDDAYRTGRPQLHRIRRVLEAAAEHLRNVSKAEIAAGNLGKNTPRYAFRKQLRAEGRSGPWATGDAGDRGLRSATSEFGLPPPYGVLSGEFIKGIRKAFFARKKPPILR